MSGLVELLADDALRRLARRVAPAVLDLVHDREVFRADGIVVLTGGASRIEDAVELLASGRGQRLLITGVHRMTSEREIARLKPGYTKVFTCCVDLDRSALNTIGNATETRRWAHERGFRSIIVVTSSYHMPRAMAELERQLPDIQLIPFPVVTDQLRASWSSGGRRPTRARTCCTSGRA